MKKKSFLCHNCKKVNEYDAYIYTWNGGGWLILEHRLSIPDEVYVFIECQYCGKKNRVTKYRGTKKEIEAYMERKKREKREKKRFYF